MNISKFEEDLKGLLGGYQSRAYFVLKANGGWLKATTISREANIPQSRIYEMLYQLEKKGLVRTENRINGTEKWGSDKKLKEVEDLRKNAKKYGFRLKRVCPSNQRKWNAHLKTGRLNIKVFKALSIKPLIQRKISKLETIKEKYEMW